MILLDTNVLSELMRSAPEGSVDHWFATQPDSGMWTSAITEAELRLGADLLPIGKRRSTLITRIDGCGLTLVDSCMAH